MKTFENKQYKITVEEVTPFKYISTFWAKSHCLEVDRDVVTFETYGAALDHAFDLLCLIK